MKYFLITGVNGFIGRKLALSLLKKGHKVIGIGRAEVSCLAEIKVENFIYLQGDLSAFMLKKLDHLAICGLYHLASLQPGKPDLTYDNFYQSNVVTTLNLLNYFREKPLDFFLYTSTISVFGSRVNGIINESSIPRPSDNYGLTKLISEKVLEFESCKQNCKVIILRLQSVFGKNDGYGIINTFYEMLSVNSDIEIFSRGSIHRNLILVEDVLEILLIAISKHKILKDFEIFQVASNNSLKTIEIAEIIKRRLSSKGDLILSDKKFVFDWDVFVDVSKAKSLLNFNPNNLQDAIKIYIDQKKNEI